MPFTVVLGAVRSCRDTNRHGGPPRIIDYTTGVLNARIWGLAIRVEHLLFHISSPVPSPLTMTLLSIAPAPLFEGLADGHSVR